jgi:hypothetical protein
MIASTRMLRERGGQVGGWNWVQRKAAAQGTALRVWQPARRSQLTLRGAASRRGRGARGTMFSKFHASFGPGARRDVIRRTSRVC